MLGFLKSKLIYFLEKQLGYKGFTILNSADGNNFISQCLTSHKPIAIGKLGAVEIYAIRNFLRYQGKKVIWSPISADVLYKNAGVFPKNNDIFNAFCVETLEALNDFDILAVWFNMGESNIIKNYASKAKLTELIALEPYYHENPWSRNLEKNKILVVHPFIETIKQQYQHRTKIWRDNNCLPEFEIETIKAPLSDVLVKSEYESWIEALHHLKKQMTEKEFDVAIVGAGAYSLPLVAHAKKLGKFGIHLGGSTQILFGIKGKRWDNHEIGRKFYNDYWVRPSKKETPENVGVIEQGAYW